MKFSRNRILINAFVIVFTFFLLVLPFSSLASAQTQGGNSTQQSGSGDVNLICRIFPFIADIEVTSGLCGGSATNTATTIGAWLRFGLSLIFIGIIIIAIVSIIKAAIEYIRSEGDEGKVQEASKSIKSVFIGIGALIVGLVGLAIVLTVIGASDSLDTDTDPLQGQQGGEELNEFLDALTQ